MSLRERIKAPRLLSRLTRPGPLPESKPTPLLRELGRALAELS